MAILVAKNRENIEKRKANKGKKGRVKKASKSLSTNAHPKSR